MPAWQALIMHLSGLLGLDKKALPRAERWWFFAGTTRELEGADKPLTLAACMALWKPGKATASQSSSTAPAMASST
jgi:hypothetical protein